MTPRPSHPPPDFRKRYGVLLDIGRILTGTLEADELYRTIYEQASRVLETTGFYISLHDEARDLATVVFYADRGESISSTTGRRSRMARLSEPRYVSPGRAISPRSA